MEFAHVQKKVQDEINKVLKRYDWKMTVESMKKMKYLEMCIDGKYLTHWIAVAPLSVLIPRDT